LFEAFQISGRDNLKNPEYAEKIKEIAEYIQERCEELRVIEDDVCKSCDEFGFPTEHEISDWLESMLPPKPRLPSRVGGK
jgi:hypothetical protein